MKKILTDYQNSKLSFGEAAVAICHIQMMANPIYQAYANNLGIKMSMITDLVDIPFLPIEAFKHHRVTSVEDHDVTFLSSGTTGQIRSKHSIHSLQHYLDGAVAIFEASYGSLKDIEVFALLPSYLENGDSSLVSMVDHFIKQASGGAFYLNDFEALASAIESSKRQVLLIGVTYALLDFADYYHKALPQDIILMETGGMKGRRKELPKQEVQNILKSKLGVEAVHSEYGMTELCSQAYSYGDGIFQENKYFRVLLKELTDPFHLVRHGRPGIINVIDLNNIYSCSFIETQDLGKKVSDSTFEILGRIDQSDTRGCNLLVS